MKLYVVRHGQIDANIEDRMYSLTDKDLNEVGIRQAKKTAQKAKELSYDFVLCSPLKRAKKTCDIINSVRKKEVIYDKRLVERDCGSLEGILTSQFNYSDYWNYDKNISYGTALKIQPFYHSIWKFLDELKEKYSNKTILIVTHNGVARAIHSYFHGIPKNGDTELYSYQNAELREYDTKD
ncbi:MAG: histidine phosphatase family protein [Bacilli bacterium]|nr:histidine phosphatase family protein [Bacilli bacterium]